MQKLKISIICIFMLVTQVVMASVHTGTITQKRGNVQIFSNPSKKVEGKGTHALYNGLYYIVKKAKTGDQIGKGHIVRTGRGSMARIVFSNGDQNILGPGTEYSIDWEKARKRKANAFLNIVRGKVRAVVSKDGPRNNLKVNTKTASMGIRGTDFYVNAKGIKKSSVSVLRGEVAVRARFNKNIEKAPEIKVKQGFQAEVAKDVEKPNQKSKVVEDKVALRPTSKVELVEIQKNTVVKEDEESKAEKKNLPKKVMAKLDKLEKKSVETTLQDIKTHDPDLYQKIKKDKTKSIDGINTTVVAKVFEKAPDKPLKATEEEFEDLEVDAYEKYFNLD